MEENNIDINEAHEELNEKLNHASEIYDNLSILNEFAKKEQEKIKSKLDEIESNYTQIESKNTEAQTLCTQIENKNTEAQTLCTQIKNTNDQAQTKFKDIEEKHRKICIGEGEEESLYTQIESKYNEINSKLEELNKKEEAFNQYYEKVFGKTTDSGEKISGLEDKLSSYDEKIQELLGFATNTMLGASYKESKESYETGIKIWNISFLITILIMIITSFYFIYSSSDKVVDLSNFITQVIIKLPLYIALIWGGVYSARRRNEAKRLQEEYKHKETMAKAYFGYKQEIKELGLQEDKEVMNKLMNNLVDLVNQNPNDSLNKVKKENIPTMDLAKELLKAPKETVEALSKIIGK